MKLIVIYDHSEVEEKLPLEQSGLQPSLAARLHELGVIEIEDGCISPSDLRRAYRVLRLWSSLRINLTGASVIVELMERMDAMEEEINRLRKEVKRDGF